MPESVFVEAQEAIEIIRSGGTLIVTDDEDRENEGDFVMAAECVTPEAVNLMVTRGRGLVCLPATAAKLDKVGIPMMVSKNTARLGTAFTVSIDALQNATTGISTYDRAETIRQFCREDASSEMFGMPGHIFPLRAQEGGVLKRSGHTEAAVDLARLAGKTPCGVLCEILKEDGTMARLDTLVELAKELGLKIFTVAKLIEFRRRTERLIAETAQAELPTKFGNFKVHLFESKIDNQHHLALVMGEVKGDEPVLVRVHSECLTGDALFSCRCDCGEQLELAMQKIAEAGKGVLVYLRQEGRGIGLPAKIKAYALQDKGEDTVEANIHLGFPPDLRDYGYGAQMLSDLGVRKMRLMTNNPKKLAGLSGHDLEIVERVPLTIEPNEYNKHYLETKSEKMGHLL
ncbi:bifunctional 3,4-dihydroxy-2-butanone-4-phosphate synthase/GTP cyclohydrolase II [bacterium]|nr:bifunctional 3,4-dihydroxy-2-butanone-4-phosphate synthase/GTP cyclohydrolase II [bacterium]